MSLETQPKPKPKGRVIAFVTKGNNKPVAYKLTNQDFLTLARAVEFEGEPREAVAWTLIQRFAFLYPQYKTLHSLIVAYAQPLNPRWFPAGDLHLEWIAKLARDKKNDALAREIASSARRVRKANVPLEAISPSTLAIINKIFMAGAATPVPGSVHYRAPTIETKNQAEAQTARAEFAAAKQMLDTVHVGDPTVHNWFFAVTGSRTFRVVLRLDEIIQIGKAIFIIACSASLINLVYRVGYVG